MNNTLWDIAPTVIRMESDGCHFHDYISLDSAKKSHGNFFCQAISKGSEEDYQGLAIKVLLF